MYAMFYNHGSPGDGGGGTAPGSDGGWISLVDALRWLLDSKSGGKLVPLKANPDRSGRVEPRVRKRRPKELPVMKKPRSEWRKQWMGNTFAG